MITMAIAQQNHLATIIGGVTVLHHIKVWALNVEIMWQALSMHQAVVPWDEAFFRWLNEDKMLGVLHHFLHGRLHERVINGMVGTQT